MTDIQEYKNRVLKAMLEAAEKSADVFAAWEGGSAATATRDQYSDIDLCLLGRKPLRPILDLMQEALAPFGVIHTWQAAKSFWGEGLMQRVIVLKDAPKHFFVDVGVFDQDHPQMVKEFLEVERHGQPIIYFDKRNEIKPGHTDAAALFQKQQARAEEIMQAFPIFKTLVLKELDRGQGIDAISFYYNGILRPTIEMMGMIHRPFKSDFGMRYIHKHFPLEKQKMIEDLSYISSAKNLFEKVERAEKAIQEAYQQVKSRTSLI